MPLRLITGKKPELAPTGRATVAADGTAKLYRFHGSAAPGGRPLLLVPSLINKWFVLDLRRGASLVEALVDAGYDVFCLDWGVPEAEDRYLSWDDVLARLHRMVRRVLRTTGQDQLALLGYCMGGTLSAIYTALHPERVCALVNLAGPIDFEHAGMLGDMVDRDHFDANVIADAGNVNPVQMQGGFLAMQPTQNHKKAIGLVDAVATGSDLEGFQALEAWASDNIPFPGEAYRTYIGELYQGNRLVGGTHHALGRRVDLGTIHCPLLVIVADRDTICPPKAATALCDRAGSTDTKVLTVPGGHVGAVVGGRAKKLMYPQTIDWLRPHLQGLRKRTARGA